jgi:pimeloyl-ACP methyl ester carboxylesterase
VAIHNRLVTLLEREFRAPVAGGELVGWRSDVAGPPALLLHGGPSLSEYLAPLADELAGVVTTARYQQRGQAPSLVEGAHDVDTHVADAVAVLDALGWERAWLIGHSWGAHLAMHVAVAHPERALGMVVIDALGAAGDGGSSALGPNLTGRLSDEDRARADDLDARDDRGEASELDRVEQMRIVWPYYFGEPASAPEMPEFRFSPFGPETWASIAAHFEARTLERGLPGLTMPVLITHGERSPIPVSAAQATAALIPGARLVVHPGRGHFPWLEDPGWLRGEVARFVGHA